MIAEIVHDDAINYIDSFIDSSFDCIILDPNYQDWDAMIKRGLIDKAIRVLKPTGNIICFTKQPFDYNLRIAVNPWFRREIAWTFDNGGAWVSKKMPLVSSQKIYWLVKSREFFFQPRTGQPYNAGTRAFKRSRKVFGDYDEEGRHFIPDDGGIWLRDHLHFNKPNTGALPAKPDKLIEILLRCFCPDGGTVLDPFLGSGSTVKAAEKINGECYGCDLDETRVFKIINGEMEDKQ